MPYKPRSRRGSAVLEAALTLPLLCLILLGAMDFSRLFYKAIEVANAASAGARYGSRTVSKSADTAGMQNAAANDADISGMTASASQFCECPDGSSVSCAGSCPLSAQPLIYVQVTTQATFRTTVSWPLLPRPITINGKAVMRAR